LETNDWLVSAFVAIADDHVRQEIRWWRVSKYVCTAPLAWEGPISEQQQQVAGPTQWYPEVASWSNGWLLFRLKAMIV